MKISRIEILNNLRIKIGNNPNENTLVELITKNKCGNTIIFCMEDGEIIIGAEENQKTFVHKNHESERAFIFNLNSKWEFNIKGELKHFTSGAILWQKFGNEIKYCLFKRKRHPVGFYTVPAGHIELNEDPKTTVIREIFEETALIPLSVDLLYKKELYDECRRGSNYHYWYLFLCQCDGSPVANEEGENIGWYSQNEIARLEPLTRATKYFLEKYFKEINKGVEI